MLGSKGPEQRETEHSTSMMSDQMTLHHFHQKTFYSLAKMRMKPCFAIIEMAQIPHPFLLWNRPTTMKAIKWWLQFCMQTWGWSSLAAQGRASEAGCQALGLLIICVVLYGSGFAESCCFAVIQAWQRVAVKGASTLVSSLPGHSHLQSEVLAGRPTQPSLRCCCGCCQASVRSHILSISNTAESHGATAQAKGLRCFLHSSL